MSYLLPDLEASVRLDWSSPRNPCVASLGWVRYREGAQSEFTNDVLPAWEGRIEIRAERLRGNGSSPWRKAGRFAAVGKPWATDLPTLA